MAQVRKGGAMYIPHFTGTVPVLQAISAECYSVFHHTPSTSVCQHFYKIFAEEFSHEIQLSIASIAKGREVHILIWLVLSITETANSVYQISKYAGKKLKTFKTH